jgi:hypothetical protein
MDTPIPAAPTAFSQYIVNVKVFYSILRVSSDPNLIQSGPQARPWAIIQSQYLPWRV